VLYSATAPRFSHRADPSGHCGGQSFLKYFFVGLLLACSFSPAGAQDSASGTEAASPEAAAVRQISEGNFSGAAQNLRRAMEVAPDDGLLNEAAGAAAICTGDADTARSAFEHALRADKNDSLALYGVGLARLAKGDRAGALSSFDKAETAGGDRAFLLLARRYAQWLSGAQVSVSGAGVSELLAPANAALQAAEASREGNWPAAISGFQTALAAIPGDAIIEPGGVMMNFDPSRPISTGASRLPAGALTVAPDKGIFTGAVELSPEGSLDGVAFVSYECDGKPLGIVNVSPFQYVWDTRHATNGQHTLTVVLHDRALNELAKSTRKVRVMNFGADDAAGDEARNRDRSLLWQALALRPGRCGASYMIGNAYRALGQIGAAQVWFARCVAANPDYRDARKLWAACGGNPASAGPAIYGGLSTEKVIALTFDDGPKPGVTEPLLDILRQERVPATFFVIGRHVMEYPELTKQVADAGMEIANHSYTHRNLTKLPDIEVAREVMQTQAAVQSVTGKAPRFLRPPGGNWNPRVAQDTRAWASLPACGRSMSMAQR